MLRRSQLLQRAACSAIAVAALSTTVMAQTTKTIQIAMHYTPEQMGPLTQCFRQYETEHPGIKIEYQQASYADFLQTILTSHVGGTSPDIYNIYSIWAPQLVGAKALDVPPQDIQDFVKANYAEGTVGAATINGQLYGIPTELSVYMLVYNKKLLADAGASAPPKTWDELKSIAAKITKKNDQGNITQAGYAFGPSVANATHPFYTLMYSEGMAPYAEDFRSTNFKSPEAIKIIQREGDLFKEGITSNAVKVGDFPSGSIGMAILANWQKSTLAKAFGDKFLDTVGVAPIPSDKGDWHTMLYSFLWTVDAGSDTKAEDWQLLKWLNTPSAAGKLSCTGAMLQGLGALTGNKADLAAMKGLDDSFSKPYVDAVNSGKAISQPNTYQAAEVDRILRSYIEQVWNGTMSAEDAMKQADSDVQAILDEQP